MLLHRTTISALLFYALSTQTTFAQQTPDLPRQSFPGQTIQGPRIVSGCTPDDADPVCPEITLKTVTMQVPEFKPGDENTHVYIVSGVHQAGCSGSGTAHPDEHGLIEEGVGTSEARTDQDDCQHHLVVMDEETFESRITLDLHEVKLIPFLTSLEAAMHFGVGIATGDRSRPATFFSRWSSVGKVYGERRLSIRGDNLTIDELLDKVFQNTGCVVNREEEGMTLASCPQTAR
jgi:hypothetical protein